MTKTNKAILTVMVSCLLTAGAVMAQDETPITEAAQTQEKLWETVAEPQNETVDFLGSVIQKQLEETNEEPDLEAAEDMASPEDVIDPDWLKDDVKAYDDYPKVKVRILDKITADTKTHDLEIGKTVAYGSLRIRPTVCKKTPPIEEPESAAFLQIWEKTYEGTDEWVFSGWLFASSPSLSAMEHPVYDVWVIDCATGEEKE